MEFLEDVLKRYGITADYWPLDESVPAPEGRVDKDALQRNAMLAGGELGAELVEVCDRLRPRLLASETMLPMMVILGDIRAERGQSRAALAAYECAVLVEDDPETLCELGYLLLQRCRVERLPLSDKDFEGSIDFGGETVFVSSYLIHPDNKGPEFPDKGALLPVAIRAFGLACTRCVARYFTQEGGTWADKWRELVALDGLRAAFIEGDGLDGLEATIGEYYGWMEDYEEGVRGLDALARVLAKTRGDVVSIEGEIEPDPEDLFYRFDLNFRDAQVYLRLRPKTAPSAEPGLTAGERLIVWHLRELSQEVRGQRDSVLQAIAQELERRPKPIVQASEKALSEAHGQMWVRLPQEVRWLLVQAELYSSIAETVVDADWGAPAIYYNRALETMLRTSLGPMLDEVLARDQTRRLGNLVRPRGPCTRATLEEFRNLFRSPGFVQLGKLRGRDRMREIWPALDEIIRNCRNLTSHGSERFHREEARELRNRLLATEEQRLGLLWKIASLCSEG